MHAPQAVLALGRLTNADAAQRNIPAGARVELVGWARGIPGRLFEHKTGSHETYYQHAYDIGIMAMCMQIIMLMAHGHMTTYTFD